MVWKHNTITGSDGIARCGWANAEPIYQKYHDTEWGRPIRDDRELFELLTLEGCQAGLSWITVLRKREHYRKVYDGFDAKKIARYTPAKLKKLLEDPGIIRHKGKIEASVGNAKVVTLEGLGTPEKPHPLQTAYVEEQVPQCGYCINGWIMTAASFLATKKKPTEAEIKSALEGVKCRCGTHVSIMKAVKRAAAMMG